MGRFSRLLLLRDTVDKNKKDCYEAPFNEEKATRPVALFYIIH